MAVSLTIYEIFSVKEQRDFKTGLGVVQGKLKNRNNLLIKLAGSTWGASANTLRSSALALCYSAAEYCAPVCSHKSG